MKIAFDIGGVISKYPHIFRPIIHTLRMAELEEMYDYTVECYVISDMKPHEKAVAFCHHNDIPVPVDRIICADYDRHGEMCKSIICKELGIDLLVDDFPGYVAIGDHVRLLVMPNPTEPYYHDSFKTDGSEGDFGRRRKTDWRLNKVCRAKYKGHPFFGPGAGVIIGVHPSGFNDIEDPNGVLEISFGSIILFDKADAWTT